MVCSNAVNFVLVSLFPYKGDNDRDKEALKYFGDIEEVPGLPSP